MKQVQKTYNNILYITDNKLILKDNDNYYDFIISSKILNNGFILNKELFINEYFKNLKLNHLNKILWRKNILIITDYIYPYNEKKILKETFREIGYNEVSIKPIDSILKINKEDYFLINNDILRLFYVDNLNQKGNLELNQNILSEEEISFLLKNRCKNKRLFIINQNEKIISLIDKLKLDYYYYDKKYKFF